MNNSNLERTFWQDIKDQCRFMCICARKGSGKSHLLTNFLAISIKYELYDEYHLVIPEIHTDNDTSNYEFLKNSSNVFLYEKFQPHIIPKIKELSKKKRICFAMDDATNYMFSNKHNADLLHLLSTTRHGFGCHVIIITHALKNILMPSIRGLIDHLFIGSFTNYNLIKTNLYEENCSLVMKLGEFLELYKTKIIDEKYNFIYLNIKCNVDFNVNKWELSLFDRNILTIKGKANYIKPDDDFELRRKYEKKKREIEIKEDILGKKTEKKNDDIFRLRMPKK